METVILFSGAVSIAAILTHYVMRTPRNVWVEGTRCKDCNLVWSREGFNHSIYTCPKCGERTTYCVFKVTKDGTEIKSR